MSNAARSIVFGRVVGGELLFAIVLTFLAAALPIHPGLHAQPNRGRILLEGARSYLATEPGRRESVDVDRDGHLDILFLRKSTGEIAYLPGVGTGVFGDEILTGELLCPNAISLDAVDLNRDGALDLVASCANPPELLVSLATSPGPFSPKITIGLSAPPVAVEIADVNQDTNLDLLVLLAAENTISVFLSDGAGGVAGRADVSLPGTPESFAVGDLDRDGNPDLILGGMFSGNIDVYRGSPMGSFFPFSTVTVALSHQFIDLLALDLSGNGALDLAVLGRDTIDQRRVFLLEGFANGRFALSNTYTGNSTFLVAEEIEAADLDNDGDSDVVFWGSHLALAEGTGLTEKTVFQSCCLLPGALGDFDEDGDLDIVSSPGPGANRLLVHLSDGLGGLGRSEFQEVQGLLYPALVHTVDLNRDDRPDLITATRFRHASNTLTVSMGDGDGGFVQHFQALAVSPVEILSGNVNGDGLTDLILISSDSRRSRTFLGDGAGGFAEVGFFGGFPQFTGSSTLGDFDEDGLLDVVSLSRTDGLILFGGDGTGGFQLLGSTPTGPDGDVIATDFDGDGHLDVAVSNPNAQSVSFLLGNGRGGFPRRQDVSIGKRTGRLATGDLDEDGIPDLVVANSSNTCSVILSSSGAGGVPGTVQVGQGPGDLVLADLDGDGHLDLAVSHALSVALVLLSGDGQGGLTRDGTYHTGISGEMAAADFDGNGEVDLVMTYGRLFFNHSRDVFTSRQGTVNAAVGAVTDVLFVNGSSGSGSERVVEINLGASVGVFLAAPPASTGFGVRYVVYGYRGQPSAGTIEKLPFGIGTFAMPTPLSGADPPAIANTIGRRSALGRTRWPQRPLLPAPTQLLALPGGIPFQGTFYFQGIIEDRGSIQGNAAVTNGVLVRVR